MVFQDIVCGLTSNPELQTVLSYLWFDFALWPDISSFAVQGMVQNHYAKGGAYYPVGGGSEFAFNMVPIVERAGGKVLVSRQFLLFTEPQTSCASFNR